MIILKLTGEHYVFYKQPRVGRYGKEFALLKFATMLKNSPNLPSMIEHPIIIEYKYEASSIIPDVRNDIKRFSDIDLLISWDINIEEFKKNGINVDVISKDDVYYFGSNYILDWPSTYDLGKESKKYVIALKQFIEDYRK
jgi:hypothetical protein